MANNKNHKRSIFISTFITLLVVAMLIFSGPAQAVSVMILGLQDKYTQGSSIKFQVQIDINDPDQFIPITDVTVNLTGQATKSAVFTLDGNLKSGDNIITVKPNSTIPRPIDFGYGYGSGYGYGYGYNFGGGTFGYADFGYGYPSFGNGYGYGYMAGYGYGFGYGGRLTYIYDVTIDTSNLPVGDYDVAANLNTGNAGNPKFISGSKHFKLASQPTTPPSGDGGGGGSTGGGGVSTPEPFENIIKFETRDCHLASGKPSSCKFTAPEHWISDLIVTGKESETATFRIEALKGLSPRVNVPAPGTKYLNIWPGSKRIQEALIRFSVADSWIASEGLTAENLRMYNWDGSKWNELDTRILSKDGSVISYEAKTSAFSYFAISGKKAAAVPATPSAISPTLTVTPIVTGTAGMEEAPAPSMNLYLIIGVFIVILAGVVYYFTKKK